MEKEQLERIKKMEEYLNELETLTKNFNLTLDKAEESLTKYKDLKSYYMSNAWRQDFEASHQPEFPSPVELPHGVLSEDGVFNLIYKYRELGKRMMSLGERMIDDSTSE